MVLFCFHKWWLLADFDGQDASRSTTVQGKKAKVDTNGAVNGAASSATNLTTVTWEREADKSTWTKYTDDHVKIITEAFKNGETDVDITDGKAELSVIFERMVQRNKKSGWEKRIRCVSTVGSSDPDECKCQIRELKQQQWQWQQEHHKQ